MFFPSARKDGGASIPRRGNAVNDQLDPAVAVLRTSYRPGPTVSPLPARRPMPGSGLAAILWVDRHRRGMRQDGEPVMGSVPGERRVPTPEGGGRRSPTPTTRQSWGGLRAGIGYGHWEVLALQGTNICGPLPAIPFTDYGTTSRLTGFWFYFNVTNNATGYETISNFT